MDIKVTQAQVDWETYRELGTIADWVYINSRLFLIGFTF